MKTITRKEYEEYLNELAREDGIPGNYGTTLRRRDPIAFEVGFNEYKREKEK